ncbi:DNA polymerase III subunit beta [Mycobacteroides abscessus]|uniref:DNA polymerase III subunit beta n=1 Tax=Mycobacteroides abscessus TaxID=36809 RepID=UPI0009A5C9C1|nr:DNA polymerase III subunit beta [Mycobacteroides abscessus]SLC01182.1 DNA polymerase III (beta chain) DnaN [Mycobacteroides abscessus subsp. abscessus]SLG09065.1 DNA polymerase III (beta chain) DnaN [Mycobacteroides abscessus subsp. abscessus]
MKFAMDTDLLAETITAAISSLPARPTSPVLGGVLIEAGIGAVTMSSFNYERATKRTAAAMDVAEPDTAVVSGKLLAAIGGNLPRNKDATIDVSGTEMVITAGRTAFRLPLLHGEDFPELPIMKPVEDAIGTVDGDTFAEAVQVIGALASTEEQPAKLTGINLSFGPDGLWLCATDRYIVGRRRLDWSGATDVQALVPAADLLATIKAAAGSAPENIEILLRNNSMFGLRTPSTTVMTRCLAEEFPPMETVLPPAVYAATATVATAELADMLRRASSIADDGNAQIDIEVDAGGLAVTTTKSATGKVNDSIASAHQGDYRRVALSARRLNSALSVVDDHEVTLGFRETGQLVSIHPGALERTNEPVNMLACNNFALLIGIRGA